MPHCAAEGYYYFFNITETRWCIYWIQYERLRPPSQQETKKPRNNPTSLEEDDEIFFRSIATATVTLAWWIDYHPPPSLRCWFESEFNNHSSCQRCAIGSQMHFKSSLWHFPFSSWLRREATAPRQLRCCCCCCCRCSIYHQRCSLYLCSLGIKTVFDRDASFLWSGSRKWMSYRNNRNA